jgi:hypothetical protein
MKILIITLIVVVFFVGVYGTIDIMGQIKKLRNNED